jgi:hypothetical protein
MSLTITNSGGAPLQLTSALVSGPFAEVATCPTSIAVGASCTFTFTFTPLTTGAQTGSIVFTDNASGSPQTVPFTGTGTAAPAPQAVLTPTSLTFPSTTVGSTASAQTLTLSNPGNATLNISSIVLAGANPSDFTQTNTCGTALAASSSCTISVTFTPASASAFGATVLISDNASTSQQSAALTGTGAPVPVPQAVLNPTSLTFPSTTVGSSATTQPVTLSNPGTAALAITGISMTGANATSFAETNTCGTSLAAGASCTVTVSFTPTAAGSLTASLSVADNATGSPQTAALTGTGIASTFTVNSSTAAASVQPGSVAVYNLTVVPVGGSYNNLVTLSATGLPAGALATFAPPSVTPGAAGAPSTLSIQTATGLARLHGPEQPERTSAPLLALFAGVPFLGLAGALRRLRSSSRRWMLVALAALAVLPMLALSGCGGGYFSQTPQTYSVTVTGTSGSLQESTTISLTVQ